MLRDSARRFLEGECAFEKRHPVVQAGSFSRGHWQAFADMGWLAMSLPEAQGGLGGSAVETAILMEEAGRSLLVEPFWAIGVLAAQTIAASGDAARIAELLPALMSGVALPVLAHNEDGADGRVEFVATTAVAAGAGRWRLSGRKTLIVAGNIADRYLVSARSAGKAGDRDGISLFVIAPDAPGLRRRDVRLIDNRWCAHIDLDGVEVRAADLLGAEGRAYPALARAHAEALVALCAEAVGVMEQALWITRDYLKTRKQFGATLGSFQSLQHRMSEMLIELELSRCMVFRALSRLDAEPAVRDQALSAMKTHVGRSGKFVCGQAIQLHGGIGVTEEYIIGHYFKRMTLIEYAMGSSHVHLERLAQLERAAA